MAAREVGRINYLGEIFISQDEGQTEVTFGNPYVIFHDDCGTTFEFDNQTECQQFHRTIQSFGWNLFDISD